MEKQEDNEALDDLNMLIDEALEKKVFTACSIGMLKKGNCQNYQKLICRGKVGPEQNDPIVIENTLYDLASLTKPLVTALSIFYLTSTKRISFADPLIRFFPSVTAKFAGITILQLLNHVSGLTAHEKYFGQVSKIDEKYFSEMVVEKIVSGELANIPGTKAVYSDLGYILLGAIVEKVSVKSISQFWKDNIAKPLQIDSELLYPSLLVKKTNNYVETGKCPWSGRILRGIVHDDNCRAMGGAAGHAGLFGTVGGVLQLAQLILQAIKDQTGYFSEKKILPEDMYETIRKDSWCYGFDTPASQESSCGICFSDKTIGHLGFTGTSLWIDVQAGILVVILTNRVIYPDSLTGIRSFRPKAHDIIMKHLLNISG